jgi:thioredoxin
MNLVKHYLSVVYLLGILLLSCEEGNSQNKLNVNEFKTKLEATANAQLIDVRTAEEYNGGHLENALNMDWNGNNFDALVAKLDKSKPVFVYCLSGGRSGSAAASMRSSGFTQVIEMSGGIMKWRQAGLPLNNGTAKNLQSGMSEADYNKLLQSDKLVLIDFYAPWCQPCKQMAPYLAEMANTYKDKLIINRVNADENQLISKTLKVDALPTLLLYKNGQLVWSHSGFISKEDLLKEMAL